MHLIVVGAGIAGSALTRLARQDGHTVTLIAPSGSAPHSLAATAVLRYAYHAKDRAEQDAWRTSLAMYREWGVPIVQGGQVTSYLKPGTRTDQDWALIDPAAPLLPPDETDTITTVTSTTATGSTVHQGDAIVTATGAGSPFTPEGRTTWGVTWVHPDPAALTHPGAVTVHHFAPYKTITAGVVGGRARLGSSTARLPDAAATKGREMLALAASRGLITTSEGWQGIMGARVQAPGDYPAGTVQQRADGAWWLGGFHRTGYALAPHAARLLLDCITAGL